MGWYNNDGLYIKFGTDEGVAGKAGEYSTTGRERVVELKITDMTGLTTTPAIQDDNAVIPAGAFIEKIDVIVNTAVTSGGSATLDIGLQATDRSTEVDYDGFVAAGAVATLAAAGNIVEYKQGSTGHGALVGTTLAANGYITADYNTAAFTAGAITVRVVYSF